MSSDSEASVEFVDLSQLKPAEFESHLDTEFLVDLNYFGMAVDGTPVRREDVYPSESVQLNLVEVSRREPCSPDMRQEPFDLLFVGGHELPLFGETHVLVHDTLGKLVVFLSPVQATAGILTETHPDGRFYECVVN